MPKGSSSSAFEALEVDTIEQTKPISVPESTPTTVEKLSLRELVRKGDYGQIGVFLPTEMITKLKILEVKQKGKHMSHFIKEALDEWFSTRAQEQ